MKKSVGNLFYEAVINKLQEQEEKFDSKDDHLIPSQRNNARVALAVHKGFIAIGDVAGMMFIPAACDFSEIEADK